MARYFFDMADGKYLRDKKGQELSSINEARLAAVEYLTKVLKEEPDIMWHSGGFQVIVSDEERLTLFTVITFSVNAPAFNIQEI